jgi:hypothetical protein
LLCGTKGNYSVVKAAGPPELDCRNPGGIGPDLAFSRLKRFSDRFELVNVLSVKNQFSGSDTKEVQK